MNLRNLFILALFFLTLFSCNSKKKEITTVDWSVVHRFYVDNLNTTIALLDDLDTLQVQSPNNQIVLKKIRTAFKKCEPFVSYLNPKSGHKVNGPALPVFRENSGKLLEPIGLQKLEESIFLGDTETKDFATNIHVTKGILSTVKKEVVYYKVDAKRFFIATHQQLLRIISFSMAGFDTPVSQWGINEAKTSLESLLFVYQNSIQKIIVDKNPTLDKELIQNLKSAIDFIKPNVNFNQFDRFSYIRDYINPITRAWVNVRKESNLWETSGVYPFNLDAPTFFENDSWDVNHFASSKNQNSTKAQIQLGQKLFNDVNISKGGKLSCISCHDPQKGYADGLQFSKDNTGKPLSRNSPTLINSIFQKAFFWDGKSGNLNEQISNVFANDKEFNVTVHQFSDEILVDTTYINLFKNAYGKVPKSNHDIVRAIASYVGTLNGFNSKFDRNIRGEANTYTASEKNGFNLFMGKALCATCHFMPLTSGTVPPFFTDTEKEAIGVAKTFKNRQIDNDLGYYNSYNQEYHKRMFKTPTIRNIALTAPYMHNGVYTTLEEVMEFYNQGGGAGLGFDVPNQTLPFDNLNLSEQEIKDMIAFLNTLTDIPEEVY
ncbi:cytochrome c peroxidase [Wenyingzhuangia heitensis]|uniref:Cytochrome c peroxidase n=1 Tax=Wenyingzhuangia heitensis TaxID=1487859 RepID=A0ABX0U852_9FLAO|nr:cytochrome c peroxidase [Wenyingzhuangia heitensis]NIJ45013.1 cytochrome c peroxidase [Wenyingzhuangia heitensis]